MFIWISYLSTSYLFWIRELVKGEQSSHSTESQKTLNSHKLFPRQPGKAQQACVQIQVSVRGKSLGQKKNETLWMTLWSR